MRIEEDFEYCCLKANVITFFIQTDSDSTYCLHKISGAFCFLFAYFLSQTELKHADLELCNLFTFMQAFGQFQ